MSVKRNLYILTDDPKRLNKEYARVLKKHAEFSKYLFVQDITQFSQKSIEHMDESNNCILWIFDQSILFDDYYKQAGVMHIAYTKQVNIVVTEDPVNWANLVKQHNIKSTKTWICGTNLFSWKTQMPELIQRLEENMIPDNINVAFITDNDDWIDIMFAKLENMISALQEDSEEDSEEITDCVEIERKVGLYKGFPKLFQGWIWKVWYGPIRNESFNKPTDDEPIIEDDVDSYIRKTLICNYGGKTVTYLQIKPSMILDLSDIIDEFTEVYVDLTTKYATIKFSKEIGIFEPQIYNFLSTKTISFDYNDWLNVFKNYITVNNATSGSPSISYRYKGKEIDDSMMDNITNTVVMKRARINLSKIVEIESIDPFVYFKESTTETE